MKNLRIMGPTLSCLSVSRKVIKRCIVFVSNKFNVVISSLPQVFASFCQNQFSAIQSSGNLIKPLDLTLQRNKRIDKGWHQKISLVVYSVKSCLVSLVASFNFHYYKQWLTAQQPIGFIATILKNSSTTTARTEKIQKNKQKKNAHKTIQQQPKEKNSKYNLLNSDLKTQNKTACYLITEFQCYSHVSL
jgi:hypothetical protein